MRVFLTGTTGMVGRWLVPQLLGEGYQVQALVRDAHLSQPLAAGAEPFIGDLANPDSLTPAIEQADIVIHIAAHVGDWGPADRYRAVNVVALEKMLTAAQRAGRLERWIQISSLGVYAPGHHYGTDESQPITVKGFDGYTQTKAEAEVVLRRYMDEWKFPAVILRPGFIYGPGDRHVLPRLVERLHDGSLKLIGRGDKVLNNTFVGNLAEAILLALKSDKAVGETFNIRDQRLVTRREFVGAICEYFDRPMPRSVPEPLARAAVKPVEALARLRGAQSAPLLTEARIKFLANNLDFSIAKAQRLLGYQGTADFKEGMRLALDAYAAEYATHSEPVAS